MVQCIYGGQKSVSDAYRAVMRQIGSIALGDGGGGHQQGQGGTSARGTPARGTPARGTPAGARGDTSKGDTSSPGMWGWGGGSGARYTVKCQHDDCAKYPQSLICNKSLSLYLPLSLSLYLSLYSSSPTSPISMRKSIKSSQSTHLQQVCARDGGAVASDVNEGLVSCETTQ